MGVTSYNLYPEKQLPNDAVIDAILVLKSERTLQVFSEGQLLKTYTISLGRNPFGDKAYEGDQRTPEGIYSINAKNPNSSYHKNLGISYPDSCDIVQANALGKPTGGDIKLHGIRNGAGFIGKFQQFWDWTAGCIALRNAEIDEIYEHTAIGTRIEIKP